MRNFILQCQTLWNRLDLPQRVSLVTVGLVFAAILGGLIWGATRPDWRTLAKGLDQARVAEIAAHLESQGVPYRIADHETSILVPAAQIYRLRNTLAEQKLLGDGTKGFELLDQTDLTQSSFQEQKRYDRAVAGELERSFAEIDGVRKARVIITRGQPSPFLADQNKPSAAVKLTMAAGARVSERQLAGIVHLTAGAVEGLTPDRVQVMDDQGLISRANEDPGALAAGDTLAAETAREKHLTRKAQDLLDRALGPGRSLVQVSVDLDFTKRHEARSDPTTSVLLKSTTGSTSEATPVGGTGGLAGTASGVEGEPRPAAATPRDATKATEDENKEFVVGQRTVTTDDEIGDITGMTVSILLDYKEVKTEAKEKDKDGKPLPGKLERVELSPTEKNAFQELVLNGIGFNAAKGRAESTAKDPKEAAKRFSVTVQSLPLAAREEPEVLPTGVAAWLTTDRLLSWARYVAGIAAALGLLLVARGQLRRSHQAWREAEARARTAEESAARQTEEESPDLAVKVEQERRKSLRKQVQDQVNANPRAAAMVVRGWLNG